MPHFLIKSENIQNNFVNVSDTDLYKHLVKVLRIRKGEKVLFLDENEIQYETTADEISQNSLLCKINKQYKSQRKLDLKLYIAQAVLNSDAQISAIQKATELGVKGIIPLYTDNCAIKESVIKNKIEKWQKVAYESVKQCERADIPKVYDCTTLENVIKNFNQIIIFAEHSAQSDFMSYVKENKIDKTKDILVIIGPEGGFSDREFKMFQDKNLPLITLGNLIYRADTALTAGLISVIIGVNYE